MVRIFKTVSIIFISILIILIVTNPSEERFHRYITLKSGQFNPNLIRSARTKYYLFFSTFEYTSRSPNKSGKYIGLFLNFYKI